MIRNAQPSSFCVVMLGITRSCIVTFRTAKGGLSDAPCGVLAAAADKPNNELGIGNNWNRRHRLAKRMPGPGYAVRGRSQRY